jgi:hypothetical protein
VKTWRAGKVVISKSDLLRFRKFVEELPNELDFVGG